MQGCFFVLENCSFSWYGKDKNKIIVGALIE
jgi:hypothetical protein